MVSISPYYTGKEPRDTLAYVMQFPNPFDSQNDEVLSQTLQVKAARNMFMRIYKTSDENEDKQVIPQISEDSVKWLHDGLTDHQREESIEKKEFFKVVISSVLFTIKQELGMEYFLLQSRDKDEIFCKILVSESWLREKAIETEYQLQFKAKKDKHKEDFQQVPPFGPASLLATSEKNKGLFKLYDESDVECEEKGSLFTQADRARIVIEQLLSRLDLHALKNYGVMTEDFCIHLEAPLENLKAKWANFGALFKSQPLNEIRSYFSEKISLYFAWIGTYLSFMIITAVLGLFTFIGITVCNRVYGEDNEGTQIIQVAFAVFLAFWASSFDQFWTRKEKTLAWTWGTINLSSKEVQRPEFEGEFTRDEVTGKMKVVPIMSMKNKLKSATSYSCILLFITIVIIAVAAIFILRVIMTDLALGILGKLVPAFLNAIQIRVLNMVYGKVAVKLNDWENHETENLYNDNLALKLFLFKFVNSYAGLFYLAFLKGPVEGGECEINCMGPLGFQLMVIFITNLCLNGLELGMPLLKWKLKMRSENKKIEASATLDPSIRKDLYKVEKDSKLEPYESPLEDYMEMAIQFGYVALFGASYPLIGIFALTEIILEVRVDAWKLCWLTRRPDPNRSENIGVWKQIIITIAYFGAITNTGIVVFTSGLFYDWSKLNQVLIFVILEHFLLLGMYVISVIVPDIPHVVTDGLNWTQRIVTEKQLSWKENAKEVKAEFNTSTGMERFLIEKKDIRYHE